MQFYIFSVPAHGDPQAMEELNHFLRANRVVDVRKELVNHGNNPTWTFCVECLEHAPNVVKNPKAKESKIDYKDVLNAEDFSLFQKLREKRKQLALKDGSPVWSVANNAHIAAMAQARCQSKAELLKIDGFGESKVDKHGQAFLELIKNEKSGKAD
ncbi:MAG: HRDC domain-containing protein [Planctomycetota bacterium]|jgi:superfamily II DNA helicase RecQ|nr:HRDC domain-containing protein [Planctomycetota bacterium]